MKQYKKKKTHLTAAGDGFKNSCLPLLACELQPPDLPWPDKLTGQASVALLFIPSDENDDQNNHARLVVIRRSIMMPSHSGQIALPGGHADHGEGLVAETVLREVEEEIGIDRSAITVHGALPTQKSLKGLPVVPMVLTADVKRLDFTLQESEVSELFLIPWSHLAVECSEVFRFNMFGSWRESQFYSSEFASIWGLTANIIFSAGFSSI